MESIRKVMTYLNIKDSKIHECRQPQSTFEDRLNTMGRCLTKGNPEQIRNNIRAFSHIAYLAHQDYNQTIAVHVHTLLTMVTDRCRNRRASNDMTLDIMMALTSILNQNRYLQEIVLSNEIFINELENLVIDHSNDERITFELDARSVLKIAQWSAYVLVILMAYNPTYVVDIRDYRVKEALVELSTMKYGDRFDMTDRTAVNQSNQITAEVGKGLVNCHPRNHLLGYLVDKTAGFLQVGCDHPRNGQQSGVGNHVVFEDLSKVSIWHCWPMNFATIAIAILEADHSRVNPKDIAPAQRHYYAQFSLNSENEAIVKDAKPSNAGKLLPEIITTNASEYGNSVKNIKVGKRNASFKPNDQTLNYPQSPN